MKVVFTIFISIHLLAPVYGTQSICQFDSLESPRKRHMEENVEKDTLRSGIYFGHLAEMSHWGFRYDFSITIDDKGDSVYGTYFYLTQWQHGVDTTQGILSGIIMEDS